MKKFKKYLAFDHPVLFAIVMIVLASIFTEINFSFIFENFFTKQGSSYLQGIISQGLFSVILVGILYKLGILKQAGFTRPREWKELYLLWPAVVLCVFMVIDFCGSTTGINSDIWVLIFYVLVYVSTGFIEEILCRGLTTTLFLRKWGTSKKGIYFAVILSGFFFGILHIANFLAGRAPLPDTIVQIVYAGFMGVFFAACMLRNHSIWLIIFMHALFDICGCLSQIDHKSTFGKIDKTSIPELLVSLVLFLPLFLYGLFILRKIKPATEEINYKDEVLSKSNEYSG